MYIYRVSVCTTKFYGFLSRAKGCIRSPKQEQKLGSSYGADVILRPATFGPNVERSDLAGDVVVVVGSAMLFPAPSLMGSHAQLF